MVDRARVLIERERKEEGKEEGEGGKEVDSGVSGASSLMWFAALGALFE